MLLAASLVCTAVCAGCGEARFPTRLGSPRPLTVVIDGPPSALYASLYEAQADGAFRLGALAVTIQAGSPASALAAVESGSAAVAVISEPALLAARDSGSPLVAIGALVRQPLDGIVSLATRPVASADALAGRTLAVGGGALAQAELATALAAAHLPLTAVKAVPLGTDPAGTLLNKGVAATLGGNWAIEAATLAQAHRPSHVLEIQQLGVPSYSELVIVVRVGEAHYDGPLLRAFLQSLTRGERAAAAHPAVTAATLARANPSLGRGFERLLLAQVLPLAAPTDSEHPFGYQDPYAWQAFGAWMARHHLIKNAAEGGLAITDEFLPGLGASTVVGG
jgi:putative hydroxymethylpyrimidine transport system substrate-binding protein